LPSPCSPQLILWLIIFNLMKKFITNKKAGLTLIEVIIATAVFLLFALGMYMSYEALHSAMRLARYNALAVDLANARFEIIKNLPYSDVGTVGGIPSGVIPVSENVESDNINFLVTTTIINIDDPFDGTAATGDLFPNDYKLVEVSISCTTCHNFNPVNITGLIAPRNLESN
jgi:prepilin-type N-terminal cleavage/methylation domain-containing protein